MYEYKVVPAPQRAVKVKGLKTISERFAHALAERINAEAAGGWQFLRTETLQCETRGRFGGLKQSTEVMMVFARARGVARPDASAALAAAHEAAPLAAAPIAAAQARSLAARPAAPQGRSLRAAPPVAPQEIARYEDEYGDAGDEGFAEDVYDEHKEPEAELAPPPERPQRRNEPLFRSGAMLRAERGARPEPSLRPRAQDEDEG